MTKTTQHPRFAALLLAATLLAASCGGGGGESSESNTGGTSNTGATSNTEASEAGDDTDGTTQGTEGAGTTGATAGTAVAVVENQESHFDADDLLYDEAQVIAVALEGTSASSDSEAVSIEGATVTLTAAGTYSLSGTLTDGEVIVDAADSDDVVVILDGVDITNADGAALAVLNADEAAVLTAAGSVNRLTDGATYVFPDAETDEPNAALFSSADLTIAGEGELLVTGNYNDGIASKDGLVIEAGSVSVVAVDDGIRGKDYVIVDGATIEVEAQGDAIKSDNEEDLDRGYVRLASGVVNLTAGDDGVQATTDVLITGGELTIDAGDAGRAVQGDVMVAVSGGVVDATAGDDAIHSNDAVTIDGGTLTLTSGDDGVHGDLAVTINGGSVTVTESFEGIESEVITINDGFIDITSDDDGINVAGADAGTALDPAAPVPEAAVEPVALQVQPGDPALQPDPGVDPAAPPIPGGGRGGGAPGGGGRGGPGGGDEAVGDYYVYINGGTTVVTITGNLAEQGDGIDANGHIEMTGGLVAVSGATDTRNSALDYSGGSFVMTGGTFVGTNVDGRNSQGVGAGSTQAALYVSTGTTVDAGTVLHLESADGASLVTFEPANAYSAIVFSSPDLVQGEAYDLYLGGSVTGDSATGIYDVSAYTAGELAGTSTATVS